MRPSLGSQTGIVLKKLPYGDADEIVTVLFREDGVRRLFAAGSRKSKKRFGGLVDHFAHLNLFYQPVQSGLWRLHGADAIRDSSRDVWGCLDHFAFAAYLAELICEFMPEAVVDHRLYELWTSVMERLADDRMKLATYCEALVRFFELSGFGLEFAGRTKLTSEINAIIKSRSQGRDVVYTKDYLVILEKLTDFAQFIMQKKSRAGGFFLEIVRSLESD